MVERDLGVSRPRVLVKPMDMLVAERRPLVGAGKQSREIRKFGKLLQDGLKLGELKGFTTNKEKTKHAFAPTKVLNKT